MKTDLAPKYIKSIGNETSILWFQHSNRYVVVSESLLTLIHLFFSADDSLSYIKTLQDSLQLDVTESKAIYNDISTFIKEANQVSTPDEDLNLGLDIPLPSYTKTYIFGDKTITINFESDILKDLIHPQIAHHAVANQNEGDTVFDIFKTDDDLHLYKDKNLVGSYKTSMFHLLQGRFALELTNEIHHKSIDNWIATFHASTITNGNEAIMIIGDSGNGKSTLSAILMANAFDLLADDFTPLHQDTNLYRYPAAVSIKKGAFETLSPIIKHFDTYEVITNGPKKVNLKYVPPISDFNQSKPSVKCNKVVYVKYDSESPSSLQETSLDNILNTLIPESWVSPEETHALQFINWLKTLQCYELNYSDNDFAISKFKALFNE
ncbi:hypothetical protein [Psychroserpens algicola]|uniref:HprK-related kinase B n=1 Tax=Psychroserpens algicola TaxID=1719034 RepID=A0ABT0H836_9FLAO|nr:hypothetical protein [Psychroserpens algicola]MCK8480531.1 hypothetical protein [Psychroserpens algicola]